MRYALRRLVSVAPLIIVVTLLTFSMQQLLPGDPVQIILGNGASDPVKVEQLTSEWLALHVRETGVRASFEVRGRDHALATIEAARAAGYAIDEEHAL